MKVAVRLLLILALVAPGIASAQPVNALVPTCKLQAAATTVGYNTKVRLDWTTTNIQSGYLTDVGAIGPKGYAFVVPGKSTTYTASFTGPNGSVVCRTAILVGIGSIPGGSGSINTDAPIDTNLPVNLNGSVDLGGNITLPTAQNIVTTSGSGGGFLGGIVPQECRSGGTNDPLNTVKNCDMCALGQLVQNLINFLIGLTIPIAALLFAWAGILYFSSRGNPGQIERAHKVFKSVVIGFILVIAAWTLVNTVMNMLIKGADYKNWSWSSLNCTATRQARIEQTNKTIQEYLSSSLPSLSVYTAPPVTSLPSQYSQFVDPTTGCIPGDVLQGGVCSDPETPGTSYKPASANSSNPDFNSQLAAACAQYNNCDVAQRLALNESSGGRNCSTSPTGAAGCMQVLATTACGIDSSISDACGACLARRQSQSPECAPVIQTIVNNQQLGVDLGVRYISNMQNMSALQQYQNQYGTCEITAAAYYAGPGAVINARGNINSIVVPPGAMSASQYVAKACR